MNSSEKIETNIPTPEQQQLPKNPEVGFEIDDEQKFEHHRDKTLGDVESGASQTKEDGMARLDRTSHSYDLSEEEISSVRQESQVDEKLKLNSDEIDQLTQSTTEQIKQVGGTSQSEHAPETSEGDIEREHTIESFQEKRGTILTNVLTSETVNSGLNLVPFAGGGKMLVESISGKELSGHKLSGKERIIHGAIGAGSLALDFTGIGEMSKAGVLAGRSVGLVEKVGAGLATKGAVRSARVFEKTAQFMVKHPDLTAKAELYADSKIRDVVAQIKDYQKEVRPLKESQVPETPKSETQNVQTEVVSDIVQEPEKKADVQKTEVEDVNKEQKKDEPASELNIADQNQILSPDNLNINFARTVENANPESLKIKEQAKNLRASREIIDGKLFYAALKGNKEVFSAANKLQIETDLAMAENKLAEYQLSVEQGEPANLSLEESLKRDAEWRKNVLAGGKLESDSYMKDTQNGLKRIDGNFVKTEYPITDVLSRPYRNIRGEMQTGLIDALRTNYEKYRKEFGANALTETNYLREAQGVGLAALEAGDLNTARQALTFTEAYSPMAGETKKQFKQILDKMKPEEANQLLTDLGITFSTESSIMEKTERPDVREARESFKREREISQPIIEEARRKRDLIMEKRGLLQMPEEEFNTYFSSKDFEVISDLKQQNVGDCYLVASIHSMSRSPNFEMMVRSSMKRLPDGSWQVKIPLLSEEAKLITITPEDILPQKNEQFLKAKRKGGIIPDLRRKLMPLKGKEGLQVLEAAYMKSNFGKVDRLASEGGISEHALLSFVGDNFQKDGFIVPGFMMEKAKDNPGALENPKFLSAYQKHLDASKHFLENFDPEVYIATASSKPGSDSNAYKVEGTNISLAHGHAYSITRVDAEKNIITLANPWDTSKPIDLTFQQFGESFWEVDAVRIDNAKLMKNMQKIDK